MAMNLNDISDASYGERKSRSFEAMGFFDLPVKEREKLEPIIHNIVIAEMIDEIHTMLQHITRAGGASE